MIISGEYPSEKAGGIASVVYSLCKEFNKEKIEFKIVCTKKYKFEGQEGIFLNAWGRYPILDITFGLNFKKLLEKEKNNEWDIFHFHLPNAQGPLLFSKDLINKIVVTFHTTYEGYNKYLYQKLPFKYLNWNEKILKLGYIKISTMIEKIALSNATKVTAVSRGVRDELSLFYGKKEVEIINNGIDVSKLHAPNLKEKDRPTILYVGRLVAQKGIFLGIEALSRIKKDFDFLIVGKGPLRNKLEEYSRKKDVSAKFLGFVGIEELYGLYSKSDILLMPSLYEGLPMVGIEGAGSGLPIAAFDGARVEDIVCEENEELIVRAGDVKALSESIEYLLDNEDERKKIGRKNRENVLKNFNSKIMAKKYIQIYKELI